MSAVERPTDGPDSEHAPVQINKYDADGHRTHAVPAHVCAACSDFQADPALLVPVSQCPTALAIYDNAEETPGWT